MDTELLMALASEGLLALSLQVGLEVFRQMLDTDVEALAGAKGTHNPNRSAYRHGTEPTRVVMGGQKVSAQRPRVRSKDGAELQLPTLGMFQNEDPLNQALRSRLLSGVSTRKYARTVDGPIEDATCVSKSEVSRRFAKAIFCSQFDVGGWHTKLGDPVLADAICDRIVHDSYSIVIGGVDSMRKRKGITEEG